MMARRTYHSPMDPSRLPPRIGLSAYRDPAAWGVWNEPADVLPASYADAVARAGGVALLLPVRDLGDLDFAAAAVLDGVHGLALTGGADLDPELYGAVRDTHTGPAKPDRDAWEIALLRAALERAMPVLAICRGLQVLNVALGGDLIQHLPDAVGHAGHCPVPGRHGGHEVRTAAGSRVGELLGASADVATYHHQAAGRLGTGLVATGWAADGTVEAVEHAGAEWVVGVQWHPEVRDGGRLFAGFVAACAHYRAGRSVVDA
jgi:putative glutamine amidotransferase